MSVGFVSTQAGRDYLVSFNERAGYVRGSVLAKGYFDFGSRTDERDVGHIECQETNQRYRFDHESGSNRY
ncbi:MAG: hypothetical protein K1X79_13080 [Oligoflexia bacterium]|nr:hypothetical protein [Oligoflexia bacterium]